MPESTEPKDRSAVLASKLPTTALIVAKKRTRPAGPKRPPPSNVPIPRSFGRAMPKHASYGAQTTDQFHHETSRAIGRDRRSCRRAPARYPALGVPASRTRKGVGAVPAHRIRSGVASGDIEGLLRGRSLMN